jgi:hypothetical protein
MTQTPFCAVNVCPLMVMLAVTCPSETSSFQPGEFGDQGVSLGLVGFSLLP